MRKLSKVSALTLMLFSSVIHANIANELQQLIDQGDYAKAYTLALKHLDQHEGVPGFDLAYGVAAIDSGRVSEGIFALERVIFLEPQNMLAKLELARGFFLLGQFEKAKKLFLQVKRTQPPAKVNLRIDRYLAQIDKKITVPPTKFSGFAELLAGYDSNINSGPGGQSQVVTLSDSALGRGDQFNQVRLHGSIEHSYTPTEALRFSANANFRYYHTEPEQDYKDITFSGGHVWKREKAQYQLNFLLNKYELNRADYRTLFGVNTVWSQQLGRDSVLKSFIGLNSLNYDAIAWKDSTQVNAGATYLRAGQGAWNPLYFVGAFAGDESPKTAGVLADGQVDRLFYGFNAGVQLTPIADLTLTPALTFQQSRYQGNDWLHGIKRRDDFLLLNLNAEWVLGPEWTVLANYSFTDVDSNIAIYEYDRQQVTLGVRYNFQ